MSLKGAFLKGKDNFLLAVFAIFVKWWSIKIVWWATNESQLRCCWDFQIKRSVARRDKVLPQGELTWKTIVFGSVSCRAYTVKIRKSGQCQGYELFIYSPCTMSDRTEANTGFTKNRLKTVLKPLKNCFKTALREKEIGRNGAKSNEVCEPGVHWSSVKVTPGSHCVWIPVLPCNHQ